MSITELKERAIDVMKKDVTFSGLNFILLTTVVLLAGICIGLLTAPFTHGVSICSNNGNFNGNNNGNGEDVEDEEQECCE